MSDAEALATAREWLKDPRWPQFGPGIGHDPLDPGRMAARSAVQMVLDVAEDGVTIGPIGHDNAMCQKDGCSCWCQACERHNWRHEHA